MESRKDKFKKENSLRLKLGLIVGIIVFFIAMGGLFFDRLFTSNQNAKTPVENREPTKSQSEDTESEDTQPELEQTTVPEPEEVETTITISAAGDFTLGTDENYNFADSFVNEATANGLPYFAEGIKHIFQNDDLSTVNLETTLTNATQKAEKKFRFKGDPSYAQILELAGIEAVNLANNHIRDYLQQGYDDTITSLENEEIGYFGYEHKYITTVKDIKIGALGYEGWRDTAEIRNQVAADIQELRDQGAQIILVHYHWGVERQYVPTESQQTLACFTIDSGADLILGHHPHVLQGIEEYNGKFIVYSLGNFMFGGNRNPSDKDTFVFQQTFHLKNGEMMDTKEINVIPFSISSVTHRNNYQPIELTGTERDRVKQKIVEHSNSIKGSGWLVYDKAEQVARSE